MLPDYPDVKKKLWKHYMKVVEKVHQQHLGHFNEIKTAIMHEGEMDVLVREDGSTAKIIPQKISSAYLMKTESSDMSKIKIDDIIKSLIDVGRGLADEKVKMIIATIDEATRQVGNHIGPHSDSVEQFFDLVEKLRFDFDQFGRPLFGKFVVGGPETADKLRATMQKIDSMPELKDRMEILIERKRREFHDREAARKLVD